MFRVSTMFRMRDFQIGSCALSDDTEEAAGPQRPDPAPMSNSNSIERVVSLGVVLRARGEGCRMKGGFWVGAGV